MAEKSYLWTTGGAGDGASTYTRADWLYVAEILANCRGPGIAPNADNKLVGSVPGLNTYRIATGQSLVDGKPYHNTANVDVTIPSAVGGGNTRIDRIVLRADWTAQEVRIYRIAGTDAASPVPPNYSKVSQSTYDILVYQVLVDTSGNVSTQLDEREFVYIEAADLKDGACLAEILDDDGAGSGLDADKLDGQHGSYYAPATQGVTNGNSHDHNGGDGAAIPSGGLAASCVIAGKIATGGVSATTQLANDIVDDTKVGNRVPQFYRRQGGSSSNWQTYGTGTYTPTTLRMQGGVIRIQIDYDSQAGVGTVTFPQAFSNVPLFFYSIGTECLLDDIKKLKTNAASASSIQIVIERENMGTEYYVQVNWLAIGPE